MHFAIDTGAATVAAVLAVLALAVVFTRLWMNDVATKAAHDLRVLGMRPGRHYKLGGTWARVAARDPRNLLWAALALTGWIALVISLDAFRR